MMHEYGLAVDIGTTNIKMARVHLEDALVERTVSVKNSQSSFGADVMARILAACEGNGPELQHRVTEDIRQGVRLLFPEGLHAPAEEGNPAEGKSCPMAIAGNTTMFSLLCGFPVDGMREYPFMPYCTEADGILLPRLGTPRLAPCAGAFIGGDVVAGLAHVFHLPENTKAPDNVVLFIDLGTNGEMVIGTREDLLAVSAAAGPAFEGGDFREGSSAVEALAKAYEEGIADETGLLCEPYFESGYSFIKNDVFMGVLTQTAIRYLQMAKAAIRTGVEYLLKEYGRTPDKVYLAGGMGVVSPESCYTIGMLPKELAGKTEFLGNTALQGTVRLLTEKTAGEEMRSLAKRIRAHNLAEWAEFQTRYVEAMNLSK